MTAETQNTGVKMYLENEIEGKGIGCLAVIKIKVGTLIISEQPLLSMDSEVVDQSWEERHQCILLAFQNLSDLDKEAYLSLSFKELCPEYQNLANVSEKDRKVLNIYETNSFTNGVFLKMSRFNHACNPNAEYFWNDETDFRDLRAIKAIKIGDEITYSYVGVTCQDRDERRTHLKNNFNFHCMCEACEISEAEVEKDREICTSYKDLRDERHLYIGVGRTEVNILREMYKLAKAMKTLRVSTIVQVILEIGFDSACQGYLNSEDNVTRQEFMEDMIAFTCAGIVLSKRLYGEAHNQARKWVQRKDDPVKYFMKNAKINCSSIGVLKR